MIIFSPPFSLFLIIFFFALIRVSVVKVRPASSVHLVPVFVQFRDCCCWFYPARSSSLFCVWFIDVNQKSSHPATGERWAGWMGSGRRVSSARCRRRLAAGTWPTWWAAAVWWVSPCCAARFETAIVTINQRSKHIHLFTSQTIEELETTKWEVRFTLSSSFFFFRFPFGFEGRQTQVNWKMSAGGKWTYLWFTRVNRNTASSPSF